jgi:hypothetical protein
VIGKKKSAMLVAALAMATSVGSTAEAHGGHDKEGLSGRELAALWRSTAKYHRVDKALASGRVDLELCFDQMGEHYADPATFSDGVLDPRKPEALVYEHVGRRLRLVAVEWVSTTPGTVPGIGDLHLNEALGVYVMHAWIWKYNPDGILADMNPRVGDCPEPAAATHTGH